MISPAMDEEQRFHPNTRLGYLKCCIHTRHSVPLVHIKMNRSTRHVSVDGQIVIRTCANGSLKYHKYVEAIIEKWMTKNSETKTQNEQEDERVKGKKVRADRV